MAKKNAQAAARAKLAEDAKNRELPADPLSKKNLRSLALRIGIPVIILWIIALSFDALWLRIGAGVLTCALAGVAIWAFRFAKRSRAVAQLVQGAAESTEARKDALEQLDKDFKKGDTAAIFAKAQLQMQDAPREALTTLEGINLKKVMGPIADEARTQRAMIHLMLGETTEARSLADDVDISRHKEPRVRATMASVIGEAWARTGQAKRAVELLEKLDVDDEAYGELKPQLLRARAFAYAWSNNNKQMKATLRRLNALNAQYLMGFVTKKKNPMGVSPRGVHPMLEKEAYAMVMRSGMVPRKMEYRRG